MGAGEIAAGKNECPPAKSHRLELASALFDLRRS